MILSTIVAAALVAGGAGEPRQAYSACLRDAVANAKAANVTGDGFKAYARESCAAAEAPFKQTLVAFNVKNGMSRKSAADDADVQIDDYLFSAEDRYRASLTAPKGAQVASAPSK